MTSEQMPEDWGPSEGKPGGARRENDFKRYVGILRTRLWTVVTVFVIVSTLGVVRAFRATPIYEARAQVLIERQGPSVTQLEEGSQTSAYEEKYYGTQQELVRSRAVLEKALAAPGMRELFEVKRGAGGRPSLVGEIKRTFSALLGTAPRTPPQPWERLRGVIRAEPLPGTYILLIKAQNAVPSRAAKMANAVAVAFEQFHREHKAETSHEAFLFLEQQAEKQREKVLAAERALQEFREKNNVVSLGPSDRTSPVSDRLGRLSQELTAVQLQRIRLAAELGVVQEALGTGASVKAATERILSLPLVRSDAMAGELVNSLLEAEKALVMTSLTYESKHPLAQAAQLRVKLLRERLEEALPQILGALTAQLETLRSQETALREEHEGQNELVLEQSRQLGTLHLLEAERDRESERFYMLLGSQGKVDFSADYKKTNIEVMEKAEVPRVPVRPNKLKMALLSVFLGFSAGVGLAFFFEYLDDTVKTPEDMEERVGVSVLGFVPGMTADAEGLDSLSLRGKVAAVAPMSSISEAYRNIRTNLFFSAPAEDTKAVVVTSGGPGDGKTTTASNLAVVIAQGGKRVLLVDADFRRPMMHKVFGLPCDVGLSNVLIGEATLEDVVQTPEHDGKPIEGLDVVVVGPRPPNPAELLDSSGMQKFLDEARERYDRVILDTPPALLVADASILAARSDGVVLVVKSTKNTRSLARRAREQLEGVRARILGGILNDVRISHLGHYYSDYYHYGYSRYYHDYYGSDYSGQEE